MDSILKAFKLITNSEVYLTIIGDLSRFDKTLIETLISNNKLNYIKWTRPDDIGLEDLNNFISRNHICLGAFGATEKAKNVVINKEYEALACRRVLITRTGNKEFLENNKNCILVDPENPEQLANVIKFLNNDRKYLKKIAYQGYKSFRKYCSENALLKQLNEAISHDIPQEK